jgi:N6-L-threonylcarbamoyladenine synthase
MTWLVLGIETSCDETAAAVVRDGNEILANVVRSQAELHGPFRGVVPEIAGRSHLVQIVPVIDEALARAGVGVADLSAVAVTHRPGLVGCLLVGLAAAKSICLLRDIPLAGVDHVAAHVHAGYMTDRGLPYPSLCLVASGGHTALYVSERPGALRRVGTTLDDAAGEALDKAAALLGLAYPGGPEVERAALGGRRDALPFRRSLLAADSLDFSFSGLKTALLYHLRGPGVTRPLPELAPRERADLAASFQEAVVDVLVAKLGRALERFDVRSLTIGGGVARNERLRSRVGELAARTDVALVFPPPELCSDNGAMVAGLGTLLLEEGGVSPLTLDAVATGAR